MRMFLQKETHRNNRPARMMYCIVFLVMVFFMTSFAGTSSVHTNMLYQHAYFADKHWRITSDLIGHTLSPDYLALTPVKSSFAKNDTNSIALFSATDNKLYLMSVSLKPETAQNKAALTARTPVESPVGSAGSLFEVFAPADNKIDTVFLATVSGADKVLIHHITTQSFTITGVDTLTIAPPSGNYAIGALSGGPDIAISGQSGIWVTGSYGLVRYFAWDGSSWGSEIVHDIDTTETVTALCKEALGTTSGKIYEFESNNFVYNNQPLTTPINRISSLGAVSNGGGVIKKKGTNWELFTSGSGDYRYFNFIARTDGSGVELLDEAWTFYVYTLEDSASTFDIEPSSVADYINNGIYKFIGYQETIDIELIDPDGNAKIPEITLRDSIDMVDSLERAHPDTLWNLGYTDLIDNVLTLELSRDSVIISASTRSGAFNPVTYKKSWAQLEYRKSVNWDVNDTITIELGSISLVIVLDTQTVVIVEKKSSIASKPIHIKRNCSNLTFAIKPNTVSHIRVFNLSGQQIASTRISPSTNSVTLPVRVSSGVFCVEYILTNGKAVRETFQVIR